MKKKILSLSLLSVALLASCSQRIGDFSMVSTRNIDLNRSAGYYVNTNNRVVGTDKGKIIVLFSTRTPHVKEAVDDAIRQGGIDCVGLSDVVIDRASWYVPYVYGEHKIIVKGYPIIKR